MPIHRGFTLIEVLVALLIVSLVFLSSLLSLTEMTRNSEQLKDKTFSSLVASNLITEIQLGLVKPSSQSNNRINMAGNFYYWDMTKNISPLKEIEEIDIQIKDSMGKVIYSLKGYIDAKAKS